MNKQRMSNILSSIQMNLRDRKDFIDELSKLGTGEQGGGEVSTEHPVRIIELTEEEVMTGKELDITYEEYINNQWIIKVKGELSAYFYKRSTYQDNDAGLVWNYDCYSTIIRGNKLNTILSLNVAYRSASHPITVYFSNYEQLDFVSIILDANNASSNVPMLQTLISFKNYSAELYINNDSRILGTYHNGTFTAFAEGKIQIYNVNSETGEITLSKSIDLLTLADKLAEL